MNRRSVAALACLLGAAVGCGSTTTPPPAADSAAQDLGPTDTPDTPDAAPPQDAPADLADGALPTDAPDQGRPALDGGASLVGRWRLVAVDGMDADGGPRRFTDVNGPFMTGDGMTHQARVNGMLLVSPARLAGVFGFVFDDHFVAFDPTRDYDTAFLVNGFAAPGLLDDAAGAFRVPGGMDATITRNPDGTISTVDRMSGSRSTYARVGFSSPRTSLSAQGQAQLFRPAMATGLTRPRVALVWDRPGTALAEGPGSTLTLSRVAPFARFPVNLPGPPPELAQGTVGGVRVGLAYLVGYEDLDSNDRFTGMGPMDSDGGTPDAGGPTADIFRALSRVALAWRGEGTPTEAFEASVFRELTPGWQYVLLHPDASTGSLGMTPFDPTTAVSPDLLFSPTVLARRPPDLVP
ncbi:MAG: hypothetical protein HY909_25190 [Deltaproteobacteria bacterium]|nr:hypothetical protein [Deltaproteobacteria bacterium]